MTAVTPLLAFTGLTILVHTISRLSRSAGDRSAERLEWYLAEARSHYDRADA